VAALHQPDRFLVPPAGKEVPHGLLRVPVLVEPSSGAQVQVPDLRRRPTLANAMAGKLGEKVEGFLFRFTAPSTTIG
jgi:hypothetical protein